MFYEFISLGWYCGTAASLGKYGLRSRSSPFDWCFSDLGGVIETLASDFNDFLSKKNLEVIKERPTEFRDNLYGFYFNHEINRSFEADFQTVRSKYFRRIEQFREQIKHKTCFIRAVKNQDECTYIAQNMNYINNVIKRENNENKIVFLIPDFLSSDNLMEQDICIFKLHIQTYDAHILNLRSLFDANGDFISFCENNADVKNNIIFDLKQQLKKREKDLYLTQERYQNLTKIVNSQLSGRESVIHVSIYGAGNVGKTLFYRLKSLESSYRILQFIEEEQSEKKEFEGIPIINTSMLKSAKEVGLIIVTAMYDYENIVLRIHETLGEEQQIVSLDEFLHD